MKKELQTLQPTRGLGNIKFGMTREDVKKLLGDPTEVDEMALSDDPEDQSEAWHYDELEISMSFDAEDDWRLITIAVSSDYYEWDGKPMVGLKREALLNHLKEKEIEDVEIEAGAEMEMPENMEIVSVPDLFINFWLENGEVKEIQWSPLFTEDDEVEWPE